MTIDDAFLFGIPFPGAYVADETGKVVAKFFHDTYKKRDSPETLIDAALGKIILDETAPKSQGGNEDVKITAAIHGGKGSIRQGILRKLVIRFELADGLHIYGAPVPEGMIATQVEVDGPPGFTTLDPIWPKTKTLRLAGVGVDLEVWSGIVDIVVPFYAKGELASETRPLEIEAAEIEVNVRYQACTNEECLLPASEALRLKLALDVIDVPALNMHLGHGQRESNYSGMPAMRRLMFRKIRLHPLGMIRFIVKSVKLEMAARRRARTGA